MKCRVLNCKSTDGKDNPNCSFFSFPAGNSLAKKWVDFCRQVKPFNLNTSAICMKHFKPSDFRNLRQYNMGFAKYRRLNYDAVPSIYNCDEPPAESKKRKVKDATATTRKSSIAATTATTTQKDINVDEFQQPELVIECKEEILDEDDAVDDAVGYAVENATSPTSNVICYESSIQEIEDLEAKIVALKQENSVLRKENGELSTELTSLKQQCDLQVKRIESMASEMRNMEEKLSSIFTKGQIHKLKAATKRNNWVEEDIAQSISLYAASPKAYRLLYKQSFPLPAVRTLQRWVQKLTFSRGLIQPVFRLLNATSHMNEAQKLCVLSFDEMKLRQSYGCDASSNSALTAVSSVQVAMLRGLMSKWKQPVFYDFDRKMTADLMQQILLQSHNCGYNVVAVVCDLGGVNRSLFNVLGITEDQPWFIFNDQKVFVFCDVPHLLNQLRNHFLDQGFLINGKPVKKEIILELLSCTSPGLKTTHQISASLLSVAGPPRQQVKAAAKLFSRRVAQAITKAANLGQLREQNWRECCQLLKITNDWFDLFNVRVPHPDSGTRRHAYGLAIEEQDKILDEMTNLVKNMRLMGRFRLLPFQKGIIQTTTALRMMLQDVEARFNVKYILTYRLNKDILQNFFDVIRPKGGLHDHPDQHEFKYRLRLYLLGYNKGVIADSKNVEGDHAPDIEVTQPCLTGLMFKNLNSEPELWPIEEVDLEDLEVERFEHLTEYISHKQQDDIPSTSFKCHDEQSSSWAPQLNEGSLLIPSSSMTDHMRHLESVLNAMNDDDLSWT